MEYFDGVYGAIAELRWSSPSTPKQIIPQSQLFSVHNSSTSVIPLTMHAQTLSSPPASASLLSSLQAILNNLKAQAK
jgi:hypothetical protein